MPDNRDESALQGVGRYKCARCGRLIGVRVPKGGDGSELRPYPHRTGPYSRWSTYAVRCDGHLYAALTPKGDCDV